ncbi:MAG: protein kinase [Pirellulales bacterium]
MTSDPQPPVPASPPTMDFGGEERAEQLVRILDDYLAELKAGRQPDRARLLAEHPELAEQLTACLAGLEFIQGVESAVPGTAGSPHALARRTLGDFRILREVGRGGMGAVYEAEQISLGRRVALKVLRFGGVSDPEALDRFRREAETVARLHHTNIVPIFAVGSDQGVNYYAMQFIEGRSLSETLAEAPGPLAADLVLAWGLQASEALTHAHQRGVIHRDVKPSNLLLDHDGRIWLTDFGLARRLDDVTLSMTGALLGTPRYMSPEQASAARQQIDRRTDIYSLGATLYELLAGQPAFTGDTPHQVIQQILTTSPTPLRMLRPDLPRDVETVVMKCLTKDVVRRYATAQELTDDLRACLERRPIRARRASWVELASQWLRTHRQVARVSTIAVTATLLLLVSLMLGGRWYERHQQLTVQFQTPTPLLTSELRPVGGGAPLTTTVPTEAPLTLRAGDYWLRTSGTDRWTQTLQVSLRRGEDRRLEVSLEDQQAWSPRPTSRFFALVQQPSGAALLHLDERGITCEQGVPLVTRWKMDLTPLRPAPLEAWTGFAWPWFAPGGSAHHAQGPSWRDPWVVAQAIDVNGDGTGDYLLAGRHQAFLLALSGRDGSVLWATDRGRDVRRQSAAGDAREVTSAVLASPLVIEDRDGDAVPDLVVLWGDSKAATDTDTPSQSTEYGQTVPALRQIELLSGRSGESLWRVPLANRLFELPDQVSVPVEFQWLLGSGYGYSTSTSGGTFSNRHQLIRDEVRRISRSGLHAYIPDAPRLLRVAGEPRLACLAGSTLLLLALDTGATVSEQALPTRPERPVQWADLDGDGNDDAVWVVQRPPPAGQKAELTDIHAWSPTRQQELWQKSLETRFPHQESWLGPIVSWPRIADLDGDGAAEVIVPDKSSRTAAALMSVVPWGDLVVFEGRSGAERWRRRLVSCDQQINHLAVGPDIDADGQREVYAVTLSGVPLRVFVDCLAGRDGHSMWTSSGDFPAGSDHLGKLLLEPRWWQAGEEGWPQLVVSVDGLNDTTSSLEWMSFSAGSGRLLRTSRNITLVRVADVDGDQVEDLISYRAKELTNPEDGGTLDCLRGVAAEPWSALGLHGIPSADFTGDGVRDLLGSNLFSRMTVTDGTTGRTVWEQRLPGSHMWRAVALSESRDPPVGDLDGDGVPDLLAWQTRQFGLPQAPFVALSGRTGAQLWKAHELASQVSGGLYAWKMADLDGDGQVEIAVVYAGDLGYPQQRTSLSSGDLQWWLIVLAGPAGRVRWKVPISEAYGTLATSANRVSFPLQQLDQTLDLLRISDLNGDGTLDVLAPALASSDDRLDWRAYDGRSGTLLWQYELPREFQMHQVLYQQHVPCVTDLEGDGSSEVLILERVPVTDRPGNVFLPRLQILSAARGEVLGSWTGPPTPIAYQPFLHGERRQISDPTPLRRAQGGVRIALTMAGQPGKVVLIAGPGQTQTVDLPQLIAAHRPWPCDIDDNGSDELALVVQGEVWLLDSADTPAPRWKRAVPQERYLRLVGFRPRSANSPPTLLAITQTGDNSLVALDATTGAVSWRCVGPVPRDRQGLSHPQLIEVLEDAAGPRAPLVFFQHNQVSHCRRAGWSGKSVALATPIDPLVTTPGAEAGRFLPHVAGDTLSVVAGRDPRWARRLPWDVPEELSAEAFPWLFGCGLLSLLLLVGPLTFVVWLIRRRQWSLRMMLVFPAIVAVVILLTTLDPLPEVFGVHDHAPGPTLRWLIALVSAPPVILLGRLGRWMVQRQWRRVAFWCASVAVAALGLAVVSLWTESVADPMLPEEYHVLDHWYLIVPLAFYLLSWPAVPLSWIADGWRAARSRRSRAALPLPPGP